MKEHGFQYLLAATLLTGVLQLVAGAFRFGDALKFVSRSVMTGFVNALAILIFMAQLPEFRGAGWLMYAMVAAGLAIIYGLPRITKAIPSPLVCIVVLTIVSMLLQLDLRSVGDMGNLPTQFPAFFFPKFPWNLDTLWIILPYSLPLAVVGLLESVMTASIVDDLTDTDSDKNRECVGQGIANIVTGFFGGMAGCAMIGQSVINVKSGGRGRLSTLASGVFLLLLILLLEKWVIQIPMAALVAVMIMVSIGTFNWASVINLRTHPKMASLIMLTTVAVVVLTHNLAAGVMVGVLMSAVSFARKVASLTRIGSSIDETGEHRTYTVVGQVFFVSAGAFLRAFNFKEVLTKVTIDVSHAHLWDITAVAALDKVVIKFRRDGTEVEIIGMNEASATLVGKYAIHDKPGAMNAPTGH